MPLSPAHTTIFGGSQREGGYYDGDLASKRNVPQHRTNDNDRCLEALGNSLKVPEKSVLGIRQIHELEAD